MKTFFKDSIPGIILGIWIIINLWVTGYYVVSAIILPDTADIRNITALISKIIPNGFGICIAISLLIVLCLMTLSAVWFKIDKKFSLDPNNFSTYSIKWCLRVISRPLTVLGLAIPLALISYAYSINNIWLILALSIAFTSSAIFILPFGILRDSVLQSETGSNWWIPKWPGLLPVTSLVLILTVNISIYLILIIATTTFDNINYNTFNHMVFLLLALFIFALALFYPSAQAAVLINKLSPKDILKKANIVLTRRIIGPILALHVKLIYYLIFLILPLVSFNLLFAYVVPTYSSWLGEQGHDFPQYVKYGISCMHFLRQTSGGLFSPPIVVCGLLISGQLIWQLSTQNCCEPLPNKGLTTTTANSVT